MTRVTSPPWVLSPTTRRCERGCARTSDARYANDWPQCWQEQLGIDAPRVQAQTGQPFQRHGDVGGADLDPHAPSAGLLRGDELGAAAREGLEANVPGPGVLAQGSPKQFGRLFGRMGIVPGPTRPVPVAFPHRREGVAVIAVV